MIEGAVDVRQPPVPIRRFEVAFSQHGEVDAPSMATAVAGTGVASMGWRQSVLRSAATAGSSARAFSTSATGFSPGKQRTVINWSRRQRWQFVLNLISNTANGFSRVTVGKSATTAGNPAARALGIRVDSNALKGLVHNGAALTVVNLNKVLTVGEVVVVDLVSYGTGLVEWYVDGVLAGLTNLGPTGDGVAGDSRVVYETENGADAANQEIEVQQVGYYLQ